MYKIGGVMTYEEMEKALYPKLVDSMNIGLPLPRLQLTWVQLDLYNWYCGYHLMIPISKHDCRAEIGTMFYPASLGGTKVGTSNKPNQREDIDTPFRDGSHIRWDIERLGFNGYVVYGDDYNCIKLEGVK